MKNSFRVVPLRSEIAEAARRNAASAATDHAIVTATSPNTFPCRHCLRWAEPGERMILFPFVAIPAGRPYSESGPIFVHAEPCDRYVPARGYPSEFREGRAVRAYNSQHDMIAAEVVDGEGPEAVIERYLQNPDTAFVHVRSATRGCFTMEVERR